MGLPVATPSGIPVSPPVDEIGRNIRTATQNGAPVRQFAGGRW